MAGVEVPDSARIILLPARDAGTGDLWPKKNFVLLWPSFPTGHFQEAVAKAKANLLVEGAGHSAGSAFPQRRSYPLRRIRIAGKPFGREPGVGTDGRLVRSRMVFAATTTSVVVRGRQFHSENLDYKHLMKRFANRQSY